tara:strand:- start:1042 stop:1305 length:264 start_codon:yes stop_codon:yes gene_type:complete
MSLNIEELKKKIIYRSSYRGSKEMDKLLCSFVSDIMDNLDKNELQCLLNLLNIDDENLYNFKLGKKININIENNRITKLFKKYIFSK